ncbi:tetratricopeptide repeat protein [Bacillaceae bacterium S4-13-56]
MHVGRRLAAIRGERGLSQEEMARDFISRGHYSNIESGRYVISEQFVEVLSDKLNIPKDYLVNVDQENDYLNELLDEMEYCLQVKDFAEAKWKIDAINDIFPFINSLKQEFRYFLLLVIYFILNHKVEEATKIVEKKIKIYISFEEDIPREYQFLYFYTLALWYQATNLLSISEEYYEKALLFPSTDLDKAKIEYNRALSNYRLHKLETAISYASSALGRYTDENMMEPVANLYVMLGGMYWELNMFEVAESVLMKGLDVAKRNGFIDVEVKIYHNLGLIYEKRNEFEKSKEYFEECIALKERNNDSSLALSYINLLESLISNNRIEEAQELLQKIKSLDKSEKEKYTALESEAKLMYLLGEYHKYENLITKVIKYYKENNYHKFLIPICKAYSEYLASKNKYKDAYLYLKETLQAKEHLEKNKK